ncbi:hypothetical protein DQG23_00255 [Paenibacillus contaminans]|uniref:Uncharacterized protein n=1 Tax=Paenibacillus contaminans TaxID=450362 RepID=A0A329MTN9_9BACL|nr:hypothetical protein DQG23_00255 [Paenibacillus contaminans]
MGYIAVVLLVVLIVSATLPSYVKHEQRHIAKWDKIKTNWKHEPLESKLWLVGQYIITILFMCGVLLIIGMLIKELFVRWF